MMGQLAATDEYDPFERAAARLRQPYSHFPGRESNIPKIPGAVIGAVLDPVRKAGATMAKNPYPEGSEEASFFEDQRRRNMDAFGREMALNTLGTGVIAGVPVRAGETLLGAGAVRRKPLAQMPEIAERYPQTIPPVWTPDPKIPDKLYEAKALGPEALQAQKLRGAAQREIDKGNYTPFFDPAKRFDVDPANYPPVQSTRGVVAQRPGPKNAAAYAEAAGPEAAARLDAAFQRGMQNQGTAENWYMMGQLEKEFIKEYGPQRGPQMFKQKFADAMAATTGGASPKDNFVMAMYGNYLKEKGLPLPARSFDYPFPIGGRYAEGNMKQYRKMLMEGSGLTPANPKRYNFSGNFTGNRAGSTIDEQMMGLLNPGGQLSPPKGAYGNYEGPVAARAKAAGVDPRYFQEVAWAGAKDAKDAARGGFPGQPMISIVNEAIERTHRMTGMPREEIVRRGIVRSEIPVYSVTGVPGFSAIADQSTYGQ